jgi:hypothetical protein
MSDLIIVLSDECKDLRKKEEDECKDPRNRSSHEVGQQRAVPALATSFWRGKRRF